MKKQKEIELPKFDDKFLYELAVKIYFEEITEKGIQQQRDWYANEYKGGVGKKRAEEIVRENAQIYAHVVKSAMKRIGADLKKNGPAKPKKGGEKKKGAEFNPAYVYSLCVGNWDDYAKNSPESSIGKAMEMYIEKYGDKERARKRFEDRSQGSAYIVRNLLRELDKMGLLPEAALP